MMLCAAALLLCAVPAAPSPGARAEATVLMSENEGQRRFQEEWGFADAIVTGDTIYLSGIVVDAPPQGKALTDSYERIYGQIGAVLARAGASWDDVVDISSFHTDVERQIEAMVAVHKRHVKAPYPAWTAIGVAKILGGGITEIKVVARRRAAAGGK